MKTNLFLQELSGWQWEICGFQKAALIIEERLDAMHKNIKSNAVKHLLIGRLLERFLVEEKELNELEKAILNEKEAIHQLKLNKESLQQLELGHEQISKRISKEEQVFPALKSDYYQLLEELLM
jgi:uncharacterized protein (DUF342 family)